MNIKDLMLEDEQIYQAAINRTMLNSYKSLSALEFSYAYAAAKAQLQKLQAEADRTGLCPLCGKKI